MGSARGWIFENESDCLSFIASGGSLIDHRSTTNHGAGHGDDGEAPLIQLSGMLLLLLSSSLLTPRMLPMLPCSMGRVPLLASSPNRHHRRATLSCRFPTTQCCKSEYFEYLENLNIWNIGITSLAPNIFAPKPLQTNPFLSARLCVQKLQLFGLASGKRSC